MGLPVLLMAGRIAAGAAARSVVAGGARAAAGATARGAMSSTVRGAVTAPSGTVPGVLRSSTSKFKSLKNGASSVVKFAGRNLLPSKNNNTNNSMKKNNIVNFSDFMNSSNQAQQSKQDGCCQTNQDPCCDATNELLSSIDGTLKSMLASHLTLANQQKENDAESAGKPPPGTGGLKERLGEIRTAAMESAKLTTILWVSTNLKPIVKFFGDTLKTASDNLASWGENLGNWWDELWNPKKEETQATQTPPAKPADKQADKPSSVTPKVATQTPPAKPAVKPSTATPKVITQTPPAAPKTAPVTRATTPSASNAMGASGAAPKTIQNNTMGVPEDLLRALDKQGITDPNARANALAQIKAESDFNVKTEMNWDKTENENIRKSVFAKRVKDLSDAELTKLKQNPEAFFNRVYGSEFKVGKEMGNTKQGDGYKYRGRGYIQLTGKNNYEQIGKMIGQDLVGNPDLMLDPKIAAEASVAFLKSRKVDLTNNAKLTKAVTGDSSTAVAQKRGTMADSFMMASNEKTSSIKRDAVESATPKPAAVPAAAQPIVIQTAQAQKQSPPPQIVPPAGGPAGLLEQFTLQG